MLNRNLRATWTEALAVPGAAVGAGVLHATERPAFASETAIPAGPAPSYNSHGASQRYQ